MSGKKLPYLPPVAFHPAQDRIERILTDLDNGMFGIRRGGNKNTLKRQIPLIVKASRVVEIFGPADGAGEAYHVSIARALQRVFYGQQQPSANRDFPFPFNDFFCQNIVSGFGGKDLRGLIENAFNDAPVVPV